MITHHRGLIPFLGLLVFAMVFMVASLVASERENDRLKLRIVQLEEQLPDLEPWGGCVLNGAEKWRGEAR